MLKEITATPLLLLVEKEEDSAVLFRRIVAKIARHWRVVWVNNGSQALKHMVNEEFPDLLVTNFETSKLDARDVVEWIQNIKAPKEVATLIFDHAPSAAHQQALAAIKVTEFLNKRAPIEKYQTVLQRLMKAIELKNVEQEPAVREEVHACGFARTFKLVSTPERCHE